jgi:hypothetical protein
MKFQLICFKCDAVILCYSGWLPFSRVPAPSRNTPGHCYEGYLAGMRRLGTFCLRLLLYCPSAPCVETLEYIYFHFLVFFSQNPIAIYAFVLVAVETGFDPLAMALGETILLCSYAGQVRLAPSSKCDCGGVWWNYYVSTISGLI